MRIYLYVFSCLLIACNQKDIPLNEEQEFKRDKDSVVVNVMDTFYDGWSAGLPKDTFQSVPLKSYSSKIRIAILESASKRDDFENRDLDIVEVYHCRSWDGEKWYDAPKDYSVLVRDKSSINDSRWIIHVECENGKYIVKGEWIQKY